MRGPGRPLLVGLLLVLGAAGPGQGVAEPREAADPQSLLRLIVEIVQELRKYHSGEAKRLQLSGRQDDSLGRREVADYGAYAEEQRVGECAARAAAWTEDPFHRLLGCGLCWRSLQHVGLSCLRSPQGLLENRVGFERTHVFLSCKNVSTVYKNWKIFFKRRK